MKSFLWQRTLYISKQWKVSDVIRAPEPTCTRRLYADCKADCRPRVDEHKINSPLLDGEASSHEVDLFSL